jgi:hypothetical protein
MSTYLTPSAEALGTSCLSGCMKSMTVGLDPQSRLQRNKEPSPFACSPQSFLVLQVVESINKSSFSGCDKGALVMVQPGGCDRMGLKRFACNASAFHDLVTRLAIRTLL